MQAAGKITAGPESFCGIIPGFLQKRLFCAPGE
jgi:hypothetical protein